MSAIRFRLSSWLFVLPLCVAAGLIILGWMNRPNWIMPGTQPLMMVSGDPYLRALMRTISASEANAVFPYHLRYGGQREGWNGVHPQACVEIAQGPNEGRCSTASGRYQILYNTWLLLAARYHAHLPAQLPNAGTNAQAREAVLADLSFRALDQDLIIYAWLSDVRYWRQDFSAQLRSGRIESVLRKLSGTWTSLGWGLENNSMSKQLPQIYSQLLAVELAAAGQSPQTNNESAP